MRFFAWGKRLIVISLTSWAFVACQANTQQSETQSSASFEVSSAESTDCRTVQHEVGETEICGQPQNIVVLGHSMLELLLALDIQPAGFADRYAFHSGNYDNPPQQIPYLGKWVTSQPANVGLVYTPSLEAVAKAQPDLILGSHFTEAQYENLSQIAPTLLFEWFDTEANLRAIATALDRDERAAPLLVEMEQQVTLAQAELAPVVAKHPKILMLMSDPQLTQLTLLTGRFSSCDTLVADLGFQVVHSLGVEESALSQPVPVSLEILPQLDEADSVILLRYNDQVNQLTNMDGFEQHQLDSLPQQWEKNAIAQSLTASKADRVYFIPAYLCLGLPGPIGTELYLNELKTQLQP